VRGAAAARGQDYDWPSMPWTPHTSYQAVDAGGRGTFPLLDPVRMQGIILNRPGDMLDATPGADPFMGGQWQIFIQASEPDDFGGTCLWMGQYIGKITGTHPAGSYTDAEWLGELDRLNNDPATGRPFQPGDLVEVRARAPGLFYMGKTNINEQHENASWADFDIVLLAAGEGLPVPQTITLTDVKDAAAGPTFDRFRFDPTRETGAERYQGEAIRVESVSFISVDGWGPDGDLVITDGVLTLPVKLGRGAGFSDYPPPAGLFDVVGIFDQEDTVSTDGWKDGYRLYLMDYDGSRFYLPGQEFAPADFDRDGDVDSVDFAHLQRCYTADGAEASPVCRDADLDKDLDVDGEDLLSFEQCQSGPAVPAKSDCVSDEI